MPPTRFAKYHGLGNDFILFDFRRGGGVSSAQARALCDRHRGVGADGVLSLLPPRIPDAAFRMQVLNADGSLAEMCGNGLRCVVKEALSASGKQELSVDTDAGLRKGWLFADGTVRVTLGEARIIGALSVELEGHPVEGLAVDVGNPHFVLRPAEPEAELMPLAKSLGPRLAVHPSFPRGTNVELWKPRSERSIDLVVFERGAGLTQACGTGAAATAVAARNFGALTPGPVEVRLPGGMLRVEIADEGARIAVQIQGEAVKVFEGELELSDF